MFKSSIPWLTCLAIGFAGQLNGATVGQVTDFETDRDGWLHPRNSAFQTTIVPDGGGNVLSVTSSGTTGVGSRLLVPNLSAAWVGDYTAAGVTGIRMDIRNTNLLTLSMRVAVDGAGGRWVSTTPVVLTTGQSGNFVFALDAGSMTSAGGANLNATLSSLTQIRVLHNAGAPSYLGDQVAGSFTLDNITLIPEPSTSILVLVGLGGMLLVRHKPQPRTS